MLDKNEKPTDQRPIGSHQWVDTASELRVVTRARKYPRSSCSPLCGRQEGCSDSETFLDQAERWAVCALVLETGREAHSSCPSRDLVARHIPRVVLVYQTEYEGLVDSPSRELAALGSQVARRHESCRRRDQSAGGQAIPWGCHSRLHARWPVVDWTLVTSLSCRGAVRSDTYYSATQRGRQAQAA